MMLNIYTSGNMRLYYFLDCQMKRFAKVSVPVITIALGGCGTILISEIPDGNLQANINSVRTEKGKGISQATLDQISRRAAWSTQVFNPKTSPKLSYAESLKVRGIKGLNADEAVEAMLINSMLTEPYRNLESPHHVSTKEKSNTAVPKVCLALSGGGIRSASVAIGALKALNESKQLPNVDVVSAISGGSYALGWYAKNVTKGLENEVIFSNDAINKSIDPGLLSRTLSVLGLLGSMWNFLTSGAQFAHGYDSSSLLSSYEIMIRDSFLGGGYSDFNVSEVARIVTQKRFPIPVIGIAAYPLTEKIYNSTEDSYRRTAASISELSASHKLNDTYLEWSPFRFGIPGFGYSTVPLTPSWSLGSLIALSGAAIDEAHKEETARNINAVIRLGGRMSMTLPKQYPIAEPPSLSSVNRSLFYATDGGFVDNLGIFPLVLRGCETVVVIDAEYDPFWQFEGYSVIQTRLKDEHNLQLTIPEIDAIKLSEPNQSWGTIDRRDGMKIPKTPKDDKGADRSCKSISFYDCPARRTDKPLVFKGTLERAPTSQADLHNPRTTTVIYAKLGINQDSEKISEIAKLLTPCREKPDSCDFPHHPTVDKEDKKKSQKFERDVFNAYVAVGNLLGHEASKHLAKLSN
jgi:hypothetical protein